MTSRKDYVLIARAIREQIRNADERRRAAEALCIALRGTNPRFDASRFMAAATGENQ